MKIDICEILLDRMLSYVMNVDTVDTICFGEKIPTLTQYWQRRELIAAVYPVIATIPQTISACALASN